jgi:soluble lytic murein transglycosylase-like protein/tetratricopeptide (TPR) repeat protein
MRPSWGCSRAPAPPKPVLRGPAPRRRVPALAALAALSLLSPASRTQVQDFTLCPTGLPPAQQQQALFEALSAMPAGPAAGSIHVALGRLAQEMGNPEEALTHFSDPTTAQSPLREYALQGRALILEACGRGAEALPLWQELFFAPGEPSFKTEAARRLADAAEEDGRPAEAVQYVEALRQASPDSPAVAARLAGLYQDTGRWEVAAPLVRWLWVFKPSDPATAAFLSARPTWREHLKGLPAYLQVTRLRNLALAGDWKTLAADLPGVKPSCAEDESWLRFLKGRLAEARRDWTGALAAYRAAESPPMVLWSSIERMGRLLPSGAVPAKQVQTVEEAVMGLPRSFAGREQTLLFLMRWRERQDREDRSTALAFALLAGKRAQPDAAALLYRRAWERWMAGREREAASLWTSLAQALAPGADARTASLYCLIRLNLLKATEAAAAREEILRVDRYGYFGYRLRGGPPGRQGPAATPPAFPEALPGTHLEKAREFWRVGLASSAAAELSMARRGAADEGIAYYEARAQQEAQDYAGAARTARAAFPNAYGGEGDRLPEEAWKLLFPAPFLETLSLSAQRAEVPVLLACSVIRQESLWDPAAVSRSGALGLMQLLPSTGSWVARRRGIEAPPSEPFFDPGWNTRVGCAYLKESLDRNGGNLHLALAAYNAGQSRVNQWTARPRCPKDPDLFVESIPFYETRSYVRRILLNLWEYMRLYPELKEPSDVRYLRSAGFNAS